MAGVIGSSGGGYATVNPTQGNPMGEALQNVENSAFKYNAMKMSDEKNRQDAEQEMRNARAKEIEASDKYKKENPFIATGITDVDSQNRASLENAMNARNEAVKNYASSNDQKYKAVIAKIDSGVGEMKTFADAYNNHIKSVTEGTANGTYNINSAKIKAAGIDETHGKIVRRFDSEGNSVFDVFKTDDEGVVSLVKQGLNSKQLIDYNTPVKAFHIDGLNSPPGFKGKTLVDAYNVYIDEPLTEYIGTGLDRKKRTYSPNAPQVAKTMAETSVKSRDNLYEIFTRMGLDPEDQSNYDKPEMVDNAKNYLEKILLANSPEVISPDPDTALASLEESKRQHRENNAIARENLKVSKANSKANIDAKQAEKNTVKVDKTSIVFTPAGKARLAKYQKENPEIKNIDYNLVGFAPGEYQTVKTSSSVVKKTNPTTAKPKPKEKPKPFDANAFYKNHKKK